MNGFYGNQSGIDFNIVKNYENAATMLSDFSNINCTVNFDEYVFLNDTGKIFRRSSNLTNGQSGAEYIGQIQGYDGIAPLIDITNFNNELFQQLIQVQNGINSNQQTAKSGSINVQFLNPIEKVNNQYINNKIKYHYLITQNNNEKNIQLLLQVPYSNIKFNVEYVDSDDFTNNCIRNPDNNNDFIENWTIQIPLIKNGNKLKGIYIVEKSDLIKSNNKWKYNNLVIKQQTTNTDISTDPSDYKKILLYRIANWDAATAQYIDVDYYYWGGEFYFKSLIYPNHNNTINIPYWSGIGKITINNNQKQLECYIPIKRTLYKNINMLSLNNITTLNFYINDSNDLTYNIDTSNSEYVLIISNSNSSLQTSWTLSNINLELHSSGMYFKLKGDISNNFPLSNYIDITLDNFSVIASHSEVI